VTHGAATGQYNITWKDGWTRNTYYEIIVTAVNYVGAGDSSIPLVILTDNVPTYMHTPVEDPTTNATLMNVTWESLLDEAHTGRDPILYYKLEWDQGSSNW
jgi:hypothetical protein